jgi:hypothetical protein
VAGVTSPGYGFEIDVDATEVTRALDILDRRLQVEMGDWMRGDLHDYLVQRASDRFTNEGDDASGPWAPLSNATEAIRASRGFPPAHPINVRTHDLQRFILGSAGSVVGAGTWQFQWPGDPPSGELVDKMETAQLGRVNPSTVARPVIALGVRDFNDIMDSLAAFLVDGII